ncbi:hypothetical protein [Pseudaminobacter sp. NGMCC 1.201702]|uniref:hypothetical protein n=1 Tax=Pseudaminobacter sp. NGMCC 1.201702 TaxID=3391825 RepID=UPI0039EFD0CD
MRVTMLAPVVLTFSLATPQCGSGAEAGTRPSLLPSFVIASLIIAAVIPSVLFPRQRRRSVWRHCDRSTCTLPEVRQFLAIFHGQLYGAFS